MSRLDKYLWAIRVFKTRSDAADACKSGKVKVNDMEAKASSEVKQWDTISLRKVNVIFQFRVVAPVENRQPAKLVEEYAINITPQSELDKLNVPRETLHLVRERGTGRPTKKDRREMDDLIENLWDEE